jgi:hypothetical protein
MAVGAAGHHHAARERFVIYGPAGALWAAGAQPAGARAAGMTGAAGLVAASGSGLVHYPLPAEPPATS